MEKIIVAIIIALMVVTKTSNAQTCSGFGEDLKKAWKEAYNLTHPIGKKVLTLIPILGKDKDAVNAISEASERFHDFIFNKNKQSWTTLGKRLLPVSKTTTKQYGNLVKAGVGGVRTFETPGLFWDRVEIEIEKLSGKAKTEIIICTWDMKTGAKNNYTEYTFPNGKKLSKKKFVIKEVHGKSISVKLRNKSATNKFKYAIKSKGILNINKQKARAKSNRKLKALKR